MMRAHEEETIEGLKTRPWSREIVADEDGGFLARIPELEGCFADGATVEEALANLDVVLEEWLELSIERGEFLPEPRRLVSDDVSGRFSVRVPRSLHRELSEAAEKEGCSLNQLVNLILSQGVRSIRAVSTTRAEDASEDIAADAVRNRVESIGALKGIGSFLRRAGLSNLASAFFAFAAERIAVFENGQSASRELGVTAAMARKDGRFHLAEQLFRESLLKDRTNLRSSSALGQLLHHQRRYAEAVPFLAQAASLDNHAKVFLGWCWLLEGLEREDNAGIDKGLRNVVEALRTWAYQNPDRRQRDSWLRHLRRLSALGTRFDDEVEHLVSFANSNAGWGLIDPEEVKRAPVDGEDEQSDLDPRDSLGSGN